MGVFTQKPSAYMPPINGTGPEPTLVGGGQEATPARNPDDWRIELRRLPLLHRGHAVLVLVGPDNRDVAELNGSAESRNNTEQRRPIGFDGDKLIATPDQRFGLKAKWVGDLASGSYDEINRLWQARPARCGRDQRQGLRLQGSRSVLRTRRQWRPDTEQQFRRLYAQPCNRPRRQFCAPQFRSGTDILRMGPRSA